MKARAAAIGLALAVTWCRAAPAMTCTLGTVTAVAFGDYNVFDATPLDSTGSISYTCTSVAGGSVVIQLSAGNGASYFPRTLANGAFVLEYNLYSDAAHTTIWGDNSSGTSQYGPVVPPEGEATSVTVYGRVPAGQNAQVGSYSDTVVVTIVF